MTSSPAAREPIRRSHPLSTVDTTESRAVALAAAGAAADKKATDIRVLEVGDLFGITDYFVICSASNERLLSAVVDEVGQRLKTDLSRMPRRREGTRETGWMLLDYGDVVVHLFSDEQRAYYDLERLWSDAPQLDLADVLTPAE